MTELRDWYICKICDKEEYFLHGAVYGHSSPRLYDGLFIHTSTIREIYDKGDILECRTRNTIYTLNKKSISVKSLSPDEKKTDYISECIAHFMGESAQATAQELYDIINTKQQRLKEKADSLFNTEFLLVLSSDCQYYFDEAFVKSESGELLHDEKHVHVGMIQDSVILSNCGVRYFPYQENSLSFYHTIDRLFAGEGEEQNRLLGYIYNSGSMPLRVGFTWGKVIEIKPGETVPFDKDALDEYPDSELLSERDMYPASFL